jgi:hyaluronoglucosaminidase
MNKLVLMGSFGIRGVIEGFYGKPWSHEERIDMLNFLSKTGLNNYFLAPKDEPGQRRRWQELRSDSEIAKLGELVTYAQNLGIDFGTAVSPGQTIIYSSDADLAALKVRFKQYLDIGINLVGIFLDDIPNDFQSEEDAIKFGSFAQAHAWLGNQLFGWLQQDYPTAQLILCPTVYHGTGYEDYLIEIGKLLDPKVHLMWTGLQICSYRLDVRDAIIFEENARRKPLYWDNFPVNDVAMIHELHIGAFNAREAGLVDHSEGLLSNPMSQAEATKISLWTIAEFLNDPIRYEPDAAWDRGLSQLISDANDCAAYRSFARTSLGSCLNDDAAPEFSAALGQVAFNYRSGKLADAIAQLKVIAKEISAAASVIQSPNFSNQKLAAESLPWVLHYQRGGEILGLLAQNLESHADGDFVRTLADEALTWRSRIFGDSLHMFLGELADDLKAQENH